MDSSNRSNKADTPIRMVLVYPNGRVQHRDLSKGRAPWNTGPAWGRAGAHALPSDAPSAPSEVGPSGRVKDPKKVAAGKARAEQARKARETQAKPTPAPKPKAAAKRPAKKAAKKTAAKTRNAPSEKAMDVVAFRCPKDLKRKLAKLGGGAFLRKRIEAATIPAGK